MAPRLGAFDADALIYAAATGHALGQRVRTPFPTGPVEHPEQVAGIGSPLLVPELLAQLMRDRSTDDLGALGALLGRLDLLPTDQSTLELAAALGASYGLPAADAVHLAAAVKAATDRFITDNRADAPSSISEIAVTYPDELPEPPRNRPGPVPVNPGTAPRSARGSRLVHCRLLT